MQSATPVARLISRHTRELLRRYFKAGKVSTPIADREVDDVLVPLSPAERAVYGAVETISRPTRSPVRRSRRCRIRHDRLSQTCGSSFAALRETLPIASRSSGAGGVAASDEDLPDDEERDDPIDEYTAAELALEALELEAQAGIEEILASVKKLPPDTKSTHLVTLLERLRADGYPQVMVFTQFTDTLDFLQG